MITPDGCSVEIYKILPIGEEANTIHQAIPENATILELGAGAGRVTHPLLQLGHPVVAVDESADMVSNIRGAETVTSSIEDLALDRQFGAVVLGSHLVNSPDASVVLSFLRACRRHVARDGQVVIEQHNSEFFRHPRPARSESKGIVTSLDKITRVDPDTITATVEYRTHGNIWTQRFTARRFDMRLLRVSGLGFDRWLTDDERWFSAVPDRAATHSST